MTITASQLEIEVIRQGIAKELDESLKNKLRPHLALLELYQRLLDVENYGAGITGDGSGSTLTPLQVLESVNEAIETATNLLSIDTNVAAMLNKLINDPATEVTLANVLTKLSSDPATNDTLLDILTKLSSNPATNDTLLDILTKLPSNPATNTTLTSVLNKLSSDPASNETLLDILTKLSSNPATNDTLLDILAKLSSNPATNTTLTSVLNKLSSDPATNDTLLDILTKLSSDPATNDTLLDILTKLSSDPATNTTLTSVLNKLSSDPATNDTLLDILAKLSSNPATNTTLTSVLNKLSSDPATNTALNATVKDIYVVGEPGGSNVNFNLLLNPNSIDDYDTLSSSEPSSRSGLVTLTASAGVTAGSVVLEGRNSLTENYTSIDLVNASSISAAITKLGITVPANQTVAIEFNTKFRYIKLRPLIPFTGGTVQAIGKFSPFFNTRIILQGLKANTSSTDIISSTISGTTTTEIASLSEGLSNQYNLVVTAVSGTAILRAEIQESIGSSNLWTFVAGFQPINATGSYRTDFIVNRGTRYRLVENITGVGTFTRFLQRAQSNSPAIFSTIPISKQNFVFQLTDSFTIAAGAGSIQLVTMQSFNIEGLVNTTGVNNITVPNGKRLRVLNLDISGITVANLANNATICDMLNVYLLQSPPGTAISTASPIIAQKPVAITHVNNAAGGPGTFNLKTNWNHGELEIPGGHQFALAVRLNVGTVMLFKLSGSISGIIYTP